MSKKVFEVQASNKKDSGQSKAESVYDDDNIPEIDTKNVIPDEVPRRDGPGGE